jgi:membrane associated rhomboid family serine protease
MLDDRPYMRSDYRPGRQPFRWSWSATNILIISLVIAFFVQNYHTAAFQDGVRRYFELTPDLFRRGYVWQLLTFQFLHAGPAHLIFNGVALWSFGRVVEDRLGQARFLTLYFLSGVTGGLLQAVAQLLAPDTFGTATVGASAGIFGLITAFTLLEPDAMLLAFFLVPVRAKTLLYASIAAAVVLPFVPSARGMAHAAHLGGILFGILYIRHGMTLTRNWSYWNPLRRKSPQDRLTESTHRKIFATRRPDAPEVTDLPPQEFISQEVDPILDKISAHGIQSLTERERQILQAARNRMSKR